MAIETDSIHIGPRAKITFSGLQSNVLLSASWLTSDYPLLCNLEACTKKGQITTSQNLSYPLYLWLTFRSSIAGTVEAGGKRKRNGDEMENLEAETMEAGTRLSGFVSAGVIQPEKTPDQLAAAAAAAAAGGGDTAAGAENPEDIELDEGDDEEEVGGAAEEIEIEQQPVPDAVFGALHGSAQQMGALDRFKKRKTET